MKNYPRVGKYRVQNKEKYVADLQECEYRSSWELRYMKYLDKQPNVLEWASENVIIPYYNPVEKKTRRYIVDFYVKVRTTEGFIKKYIIEIKPLNQCNPPKKQKRTSNGYRSALKAYIRNQSKWKAAKKWADRRGWEFIVITEKELGIK
jgi:hypothetical protein